MPKIDEQVSYNWLFFLFAGLFAAVTVWAIFDETVSRREYKMYQEQFFKVDADLDKKALDGEQQKLDANAEYKAVQADRAQREEALRTTQRAAYEQAQQDMANAQFAYFDKNQQYTFAKSEATEDFYWYTEAKHASHTMRSDLDQDPEVAEAEKKYSAASKEETDLEEAAGTLKEALDAAKAKADSFTQPIEKDKKRIQAIEKDRDAAQRKYLAALDKQQGLFGADTEIIQEDLPEIGRVDRCESCHMGANHGGYEAVEPFYFRSHPFRRTLFKYHPVEKFGCTACHDGQGRATTKFFAHAPGPDQNWKAYYTHFWERPLLRGAEMEANCRGCHVQEMELKSRIQCGADVECAPANLRAELLGGRVATMTETVDASQGEYRDEAVFTRLANTDLDIAYQKTPETSAVHVDVQFPATATRLSAERVAGIINDKIGRRDENGVMHGSTIEVQSSDAGYKIELYTTDANDPENTGAERLAVIGGTAAPILGFTPGKLVSQSIGGKTVVAIADGAQVATDTYYSCRVPGTGVTDADTEALAPPAPPASASAPAGNPAKAAPKDEPMKYCSVAKAVYNVHGTPATTWSAPEIDMAPHLSRGRRIIDEVGCFGCHPVEGYNDRPKNAPNLAHIKDKIAQDGYGWITAWIEDPKAFRPSTRMPRFWPELQHSEDYTPVTTLPTEPGHPEWNAAQRLQWYSNQRSEEVTAIVSFLVSDTNRTFKDVNGGTFIGQSKEFTLLKAPAGDPQNGERLIGTLGCIGCHSLDLPDFPIKKRHLAAHYGFAPDLSNEGSKTTADWIYTWVKNPKAWNPQSRMPNLRLSDQEAADIAAFLMTKKAPRSFPPNPGVDPNNAALVAKGQALVKYYGCYGCHNVTGFETTPGIGVDLSEFGDKSPDRLDFGDYIPDPTQQTWHRWVTEKLRHPRVYRYERVDTRMPQFDFTEDEIKDLVVVLQGMRGDGGEEGEARRVLGHTLTGLQAKRAEGEGLVRWYNCQGCHTLDSTPGDIRQKWDTDQNLATYAPPVLDGEGQRVQEPWLFGFLKRPFRMRPRVEPRMPTFGFTDDQATNLVAMFSDKSKAAFPFEWYGDVTEPTGDDLTVAEGLFSGSQCTQCHMTEPLDAPGNVGQPTIPEGKQGPDLTMAKTRLRAEWVRDWLANPAGLVPAVNMSGFWDGYPATAWLTAVHERPAILTLPGASQLQNDNAAQIDLVTRYLWHFTGGTAQATANGVNPATAGGGGGGVPRAPQAPVSH